MKAVILCAGYGKRMKPYTDTYQKTMIPVHGKPLLEYIVKGISSAGIKDFIIVVGYRKEQIISYFGNGEKLGIKINYIEQKTLNGTGGALLLCEKYLQESHFFLTWGDILVPYRIYKKVYDLYLRENEDFILVTNYMENLQKGCAIYCENGYCKMLIEKPPPGTQQSKLNNCGIFIMSKEIFEELKNLKPSKRGELEVPDAINNGIRNRNWRVRVLKMESHEFRGDFGDLKEYERLNSDDSWLKELIKN
ncbi:MAG: nucleotidyltransferase family protein [Promethearchaeia archaeon]